MNAKPYPNFKSKRKAYESVSVSVAYSVTELCPFLNAETVISVSNS